MILALYNPRLSPFYPDSQHFCVLKRLLTKDEWTNMAVFKKPKTVKLSSSRDNVYLDATSTNLCPFVY